MIVGLGTDIVQHSRIAALLEKTPDAPQRLLNQQEFAACGNNVEKLASRFAAKEATAKALGTGFRNGVSYRDIEIRNDLLGKPYIVLNGTARETAESLGVAFGVDGTSELGILLTISHEKEYSVATVLLQTLQ